jgi:hypothetical protein
MRRRSVDSTAGASDGRVRTASGVCAVLARRLGLVSAELRRAPYLRSWHQLTPQAADFVSDRHSCRPPARIWLTPHLASRRILNCAAEGFLAREHRVTEPDRSGKPTDRTGRRCRCEAVEVVEAVDHRTPPKLPQMVLLGWRSLSRLSCSAIRELTAVPVAGVPLDGAISAGPDLLGDAVSARGRRRRAEFAVLLDALDGVVKPDPGRPGWRLRTRSGPHMT